MTLPLSHPSLAGRFDIRAEHAPIVVALRGWVCDRYTDGGMQGSALLARAAAARLNAPLLELGEPESALDIGWQASLAKATPFLRDVQISLDEQMARGRRPLIFANRCGASIATIATALRHRPDAKVVWCDAHGDFNTPASTPTGYLGGMILTALCGLWTSGFGAGLTPDRLVLVAPRDLDTAEQQLIAQHKVQVVRAVDGHIDPAEMLEAVGGAPIWLHVDTDVVDPMHLPAEYQVADGLHPDALSKLLGQLVHTSELVGFELTEFEAPPEGAARDRAVAAVLAMIEPVLQRCAIRA